MNRTTQLTKSILGFMEDWNAYKKGLKGLKNADWCILSDYCFDDKGKEDALTFTIFPYNYVRQVLHEIEANIPCDIKKMTVFKGSVTIELTSGKGCFAFKIGIF